MFIKKMKFFIILFLIISTNNLRAEFFENLSKIIDENNMSYDTLESLVKDSHNSNQGLFNNAAQHWNHIEF